jgi:lysophospholipase L1-like esterase
MRSARLPALALIGLVWVVLCALLADFLVRQLVDPPVPAIAFDSALGWRYSRNLRLPTPGGWFRTNDSGFRDSRHAEAKPPGVFRILVLGDSYAAGDAVPEGGNFPALLEAKLNAGGLKAEVINASVPAWATDQELLYYLEEGRIYHPDLVLLAAVPNDLREAYGKGFFALDGQGNLEPRPVPQPPLRDRLLWLGLNHSATLQWLAESRGFNDVFAILSRTYRLTFPLGQGQCTDYDLLSSPPAPEVLPARLLFEKMVGRLAEAIRQDHGELALTAIPTKLEFWEPVPPWPHLKPGSFSEYVKSFAEREGLGFVDLFSPMSADADPLRFFLTNDYHFNGKGHSLVAERLAEWVMHRQQQPHQHPQQR